MLVIVVAIISVLISASPPAALPLNGPWKFHTGDDVRWAAPAFRDADWQSVDLTPVPGAHDPDVGLSGWVSGWSARGYPRYTGYAWYRMRVALVQHGSQPLEMIGPVLVDSAYELYVDGHLLGGIGDLSSAHPVAYGVHPVIFAIPANDVDARPAPRDMVVAIRVWMGPWNLGLPAAGGIHIAPVLGNSDGIASLYKADWLERIRGDVLEVLQAFLFALLALFALSLFPYDTSNRAFLWLAAALILTGLIRANLVYFWCSGLESVDTFRVVQGVFFIPAALGAWLLTWYYWFRLERIAWIAPVIYVLTVVYSISAFGGANAIVVWDRRALLIMLAIIVYQGIRNHPRTAAIALPALVLVSVGQFAREISAFGVPSIWFPFGMGVSLSNYAYLLATPALYLMLLSVQLRFARHYRWWAAAVP